MGLGARSGGMILLSVAAAAALSASGLGGAAASAARTSWPAQVTRPGAASCPRGETLIAPTSGWTDALGVAHISYRAAPGIVANIPPRSLTTRQVTPAVLADLGMHGRRPAASGDRRLVRQVIRLGRNRTAPEFCRSPAVPDPINTRAYGKVWAGYAVTEAEFGGGINGVTGSWSVPQSMTRSAPSAESTWVGIGGQVGEGSSTWGLIQTGSEMQTNEGYRTFWEYIGSSGCVTTFCGNYSSVNAVRPGVAINAYVWWDTSTTATFLLATPTGSGGWSITDHAVNIPYDHTSAEWITERTPGFTYYDSPGTVSWTGQGLTGSFGGQGSFGSPFAGSFEALIMDIASTSGTSCDGAVLAYPVGAANTAGGGTSQTITCSISGVDSP